MKTLKYFLTILIFFAIPLVIVSCDPNVEFAKPQPVWITKNEAVFPVNLRGSYKGGTDTMQISEKRVTDNHYININISDSVVFRIYNESYFLNAFDSKEKAWIVFLARQQNERIFLYCLFLKDEKVMEKLKKITKLQLTKDSSGTISRCVIDPSEKEFKAILDQNLFSVSDTLVKLK